MKKIILILLAAFILLSGCSPKAEDNSAGNSVSDSSSSSEASTSSDTADSGSASGQQIQVDKGLLNVKITLPASLFEGSESTKEEIEADAKAKGIKNVTFNDDGSVTYEMSKATHNQLLDDLKKGIDESIEEMLSDTEFTSSFESIKYNDNCSEFNVLVDGSKYNEWESLAALSFIFQGLFYQCLQGTDPDDARVIVNFVDKDTGKILNTADSSKMGESQ